MIGTYARSLRHLKNSVEGKKLTKVIINSYGNILMGCVANVKLSNGKEQLALFQNMNGENKRYISAFAMEEHERISRILNGEFNLFMIVNNECMERYSSILILPKDFDEEYEKFCKGNRKLLEQIFGRYCGSEAPICKYIFSLTDNKPNLFVWALSNYFKHRVSVFTLFHILMWNENYNKLSNKLSKGSITAYNGYENILLLEEELSKLRSEKRANDSINMFNTFQKKALKTVELTPKTLDILNKFARLSKVKKINFVRKMSTIDSTDEIFKQMSFLASSQFEWNKESLIEYINNVDNINAEIIEDKDDILLVKVNDYDTVKYLARATNWCISKNKKYWNDYVEFRDNATQYIIFDFSKREDDKLSIIGFTTDKNIGITNAHNYVNDNLMGSEDDEYRTLLKSFVPQISNNIFSILKSKKLNVNKLLNTNSLHYNWDKVSFMSFLNYCANENDYTILHEDDESVVLTIKSENTRHIIGKGYSNVVGRDDRLYNIIIFANFNDDEYDKNRLLWGRIAYNNMTHEEFCEAIYNVMGQISSLSIDTLLEKYDLPYDTICRIFDEKQIFKDSINSLNISKINNLLKNKEVINGFKNSKDYNGMAIFNALNVSLFRYTSFDFINTVYQNDLELIDIVNPRRLNQFIGNLLSTIVDYYFDSDNHVITKEDISEFYKGNLSNQMSRYVGFFEALKIVSSHEKTNDVFKDAIYNFMDGGSEFTMLIAPILAKNVNVDDMIYQERFFNAIVQYECEEALDIILSRNPKKPILEYFKSIMSNGKMKDKILKLTEEKINEPSFSFS